VRSSDVVDLWNRGVKSTALYGGAADTTTLVLAPMAACGFLWPR
jgi:hypothetical protein